MHVQGRGVGPVNKSLGVLFGPVTARHISRHISAIDQNQFRHVFDWRSSTEKSNSPPFITLKPLTDNTVCDAWPLFVPTFPFLFTAQYFYTWQDSKSRCLFSLFHITFPLLHSHTSFLFLPMVIFFQTFFQIFFRIFFSNFFPNFLPNLCSV